MITFRHLDLFGSGPSTTQPGPVISRDALADPPGLIGDVVIAQGVRAREIVQQGTLIADSPEQLAELQRAVEAEVGNGPATLTDERGRDWPDCVMRRFEPGAVTRIGPRMAVDYSITYLRTSP